MADPIIPIPHSPGPWTRDERRLSLVDANGKAVLISDCSLDYASAHGRPERMGNGTLVEHSGDLYEAALAAVQAPTGETIGAIKRLGEVLAKIHVAHANKLARWDDRGRA